jgi:hypothetical protein
VPLQLAIECSSLLSTFVEGGLADSLLIGYRTFAFRDKLNDFASLICFNIFKQLNLNPPEKEIRYTDLTTAQSVPTAICFHLLINAIYIYCRDRGMLKLFF